MFDVGDVSRQLQISLCSRPVLLIQVVAFELIRNVKDAMNGCAGHRERTHYELHRQRATSVSQPASIFSHYDHKMGAVTFCMFSQTAFFLRVKRDG